jgi:hypothetical protein
MNLKLLTAAAVLSTAIAAPALAQDSHGRSDAIRQSQTQDRVYHRHNGFWPGEVAAGVVGGAIGTAGAIATAPFRNDVYALTAIMGAVTMAATTAASSVSPERCSGVRTVDATSVSNKRA